MSGIKIEFDANNNPIAPSFILTKKDGTTIGCITHVTAIHLSDNTDVAQVSFKVMKNGDGVCAIWDELTDLKLIYCPEWDKWFEIAVNVYDTASPYKMITAKHLPQAELSQYLLHEVEINTEDDIAREEYTEPTTIYNTNDKSISLLDRLISEKAPHYSIAHVDNSLRNIQRSYSFNGVSIKDAFDEVAESIEGIFIYGESNDTSRTPKRTISLYDLNCSCNDCGYRAKSFKVCPECGSTNVTPGYGKDTTIFVNKDNLTEEVNFSVDVDSVKNCFYLEAGDDLMTATVVNCNPNGSQYMWYISDEVRAQMPSSLVSALNSYDALYNDYNDTHEFTITASAVTNYNNVVIKYYPTDYQTRLLPSSFVGYKEVTRNLYEVIDFQIYLKDGMLPDYEIPETTAVQQAALLTVANLSPISVSNINTATLATVNNYAEEMAKILVDGRYKAKVRESSYNTNSHVWTGNFTVTSYADPTDFAISNIISVIINGDYENYILQKIKTIINKNEVEDYSISTILAMSVTESGGTYSGELIEELEKYNYTSLKYIHNCCQSVLDVLTDEGVGNERFWDSVTMDNLYDQLYFPYYTKLKAIKYEMDLRQADIDVVTSVYDEITALRIWIQGELDMESYLGTDLWHILCSFKREDTYSNRNFISDGLSNGQLVANAQEFLEDAAEEIVKSATMQRKITSTLKNLLVIKEFEKLVNNFAVWNWIRIEADGEIYKLRLIGYDINFDSLDELDVDFSDVINGGGISSDSKSLYQNMKSITTSYSAVEKQSEEGLKAKIALDDMSTNGIYAQSMPIINSDNQSQTWDEHGMLFRRYDDIEQSYDDTQLKIINSTIAITDDNWQTIKTAIGLFKYIDPQTDAVVSAYGINGETILGKIILGESLGIYNQNLTMSFNANGLTITNGTNSVYINPNDTDSVFRLNDGVKDVIYFDENGNAVFDGMLTIGTGANIYNHGYDTFDQITNSTLYLYTSDSNTTASLYYASAFIGTKCMKVTSTNANGGYAYLGSSQGGNGAVVVHNGFKYKLSFYARSDSGTAQIHSVVAERPSPSAANTAWHNEQFEVGTTWTRFVQDYQSNAEQYIVIGVGTYDASTIYFDGFQIEIVDSFDQNVSPLSLAGSTLINGANIITDTLKSNNYAYTSGLYSTAGTYFNLADGSITSKNFAITSNGNAYFKGTISADDGDIAGWSINVTGLSSSSGTGVNLVSTSLNHPTAAGDYIIYGSIAGHMSTYLTANGHAWIPNIDSPISCAKGLQVYGGGILFYNEGTQTTTYSFMCQMDANFTNPVVFSSDVTFNDSTGSTAITFNPETTFNNAVYAKNNLDVSGTLSLWPTGTTGQGTSIYIRSGILYVGWTRQNSGSFVPAANSSMNLGSTITPWSTLYADDGVFNDDVGISGDLTVGGNIGVTGSIWLGSVSIASNGSTLYMGSVYASTGSFTPNNGTLDLGTSGSPWGTVYSSNGVSQTSDARFKHDIVDLDDKAIDLVMGITPVSYHYNDIYPEQGHYGFIAQNVKEIMDKYDIYPEDFAGYVDNSDVLSLRYTEFIAPIIYTIQKQEKRIKYLESLIKEDN